MKVIHTIGVGSMSGKNAQGVFIPTKLSGVSYLRQYTYPTLTTNNQQRGDEIKNLKALYNSLSSDYKEELKLYSKKYNNLPNYAKPNAVRTSSAFAVYVMLIWNIEKSDPGHIDIATVTQADLDLIVDGAESIALQVDAGYLLSVPGYEMYTSNWS